VSVPVTALNRTMALVVRGTEKSVVQTAVLSIDRPTDAPQSTDLGRPGMPGEAELIMFAIRSAIKLGPC